MSRTIRIHLADFESRQLVAGLDLNAIPPLDAILTVDGARYRVTGFEHGATPTAATVYVETVAAVPSEGNYMLECRSAGSDTWYASPHPARPKAEAEAYATQANERDRSVVYRAVPWDGK